jgi:hypothetical protein
MLSLRVFGEDITKPHTANVKGTQPESTNQKDEDAVEQATGPGAASEVDSAEQKQEVDEEAALNA